MDVILGLGSIFLVFVALCAMVGLFDLVFPSPPKTEVTIEDLPNPGGPPLRIRTVRRNGMILSQTIGLRTADEDMDRD